MITVRDINNVLISVIPLYTSMFLGYFSMKWWKIFTPDQCIGINRLVSKLIIPLLTFEFISQINPYKMDISITVADGVSKVLVLLVLFSWARFSKRGSLDWAITLFSLATIPNVLFMGPPILKSMYGDDEEGAIIQIVLLQVVVWFNLLLFLFEYRKARILILHKYNESIGSNTDISGENVEGIQKFGSSNYAEKEEVLNVTVTRISNTVSSDFDPHTAQNLDKVAPESARFKPTLAAALVENGAFDQSIQVCQREDANKIEVKEEEDGRSATPMVPKFSSSVLTQTLIPVLKTVCFELSRNPNSYATILGLIWAFISCRWNIKEPGILKNSISILSNGGIGLSMFSLGLFMAQQPRIIACGKKMAAYVMLIKFVVGPSIMAIASIGVRLEGTKLRASIVQAALPESIIPFIFASEYNLHRDVLSTAVSFGMIISLPIAILYYVFLSLFDGM